MQIFWLIGIRCLIFRDKNWPMTHTSKHIRCFALSVISVIYTNFDNSEDFSFWRCRLRRRHSWCCCKKEGWVTGKKRNKKKSFNCWSCWCHLHWKKNNLSASFLMFIVTKFGKFWHFSNTNIVLLPFKNLKNAKGTALILLAENPKTKNWITTTRLLRGSLAVLWSDS